MIKFIMVSEHKILGLNPVSTLLLLKNIINK